MIRRVYVAASALLAGNNTKWLEEYIAD